MSFLEGIFFEQDLFGDVVDLVGKVGQATVEHGPELAVMGGSAVAGVAGVVTALSAAGIVTAPVAAGAGVVAASATAVAAGGVMAAHFRDSSLTSTDVAATSAATIGAIGAYGDYNSTSDDEVDELLK